MCGMYISKKLICKDTKKRRLVDTKVLGDWYVKVFLFFQIIILIFVFQFNF